MAEAVREPARPAPHHGPARHLHLQPGPTDREQAAADAPDAPQVHRGRVQRRAVRPVQGRALRHAAPELPRAGRLLPVDRELVHGCAAQPQADQGGDARGDEALPLHPPHRPQGPDRQRQHSRRGAPICLAVFPSERSLPLAHAGVPRANRCWPAPTPLC